jgi:hypothetical protein
MTYEDRAILRARNLETPLLRLQELAPRLFAVLPDTPDGCADHLSATRQEIEDTAEYLLDRVANRGGCLVRRGGGLTAFDSRDDFYVTRS